VPEVTENRVIPSVVEATRLRARLKLARMTDDCHHRDANLSA